MITQTEKTLLAKAAMDASEAIIIKSASATEAESQVLAHLLSTEGMSKKASLALLLSTGDAVIRSHYEV